jgi:methionyl-tRNA formyltransferase
MRVVVTTRIFPVAVGFTAGIREAGHDVVALLTNRGFDGTLLGGALTEVQDDLDIIIPARRASLAPLLRAVEPDLVVCMGFPWKIPADALAVPALGWLNGHPSLLPQHRGPIPLSWAIRNGDVETGITFHFMDADLDTGPIVAQRAYEIGEYVEPDEFYARMGTIVPDALGEALERIAAGERGTPQPAGGTYESFFGEDVLWLDPSRPAVELHRLAWAWRYTPPFHGLQGLLADLGGGQVRILATSLGEVDGATRVECGDGPLWIVRTEPVEEPPPPSATP